MPNVIALNLLYILLKMVISPSNNSDEDIKSFPVAQDIKRVKKGFGSFRSHIQNMYKRHSMIEQPTEPVINEIFSNGNKTDKEKHSPETNNSVQMRRRSGTWTNRLSNIFNRNSLIENIEEANMNKNATNNEPKPKRLLPTVSRSSSMDLKKRTGYVSKRFHNIGNRYTWVLDHDKPIVPYNMFNKIMNKEANVSLMVVGDREPFKIFEKKNELFLNHILQNLILDYKNLEKRQQDNITHFEPENLMDNLLIIFQELMFAYEKFKDYKFKKVVDIRYCDEMPYIGYKQKCLEYLWIVEKINVEQLISIINPIPKSSRNSQMLYQKY